MKIDEADTELLKAWTIARLEHLSSEVDADVLAEYVLALVTTDEPAAVARAHCIDNLADFLSDKAEPFVDDLFAAIATRAYDPSRPPPRAPQKPSRAGYNHHDPPPVTFNAATKRSHADSDLQHQQDVTDRPAKHVRRGAKGASRHSGRSQRNVPVPPYSPPGLPPFDAGNPMASFIAMAAAMGMLPSNMSASPQHAASRNRCQDFDTKGFCMRGAKCPYEHGNEAYVVPDDGEYVDFHPDNELLTGLMPAKNGMMSYSPLDWSAQQAQKGPASKRGKGRGRRADFSLQGSNWDQSITTIVVEQIPKDKFEEQAVRDFFAEFGTIEDITLLPYKRLAIVKYDCYSSANAAYNSPKPVFDNRFVKVYWYKSPDPLSKQPDRESNGDGDLQEQEPEVDIEKIRQRQEEAQRRYEEKQKMVEEARQHRQEIDSKLKELDGKRRSLSDELAKKQGKPVESERTRHMREQLAKLEEEARTLGIDPDAVAIGQDWSVPNYQSRGRGGYRGRGQGRGGYRSHWAGAAKGGAVRRLDNRSKTVLVEFPNGTYDEHQEALRSWLLFNMAEHASLDRHPEQHNAALVTFEERYQGEIFRAATGTSEFPLHGKVELSWYAGAPVINGLRGGVKIEDSSSNIAEAQQDDQAVIISDDYDVAHEDDRWG